MDAPPSATFAAYVEFDRLHARVARALDAQLRQGCRISLVQYRTLEAVRFDPPCRTRDIQASLDITAGAASKVAGRLVEARLLRRTSNPYDARSSLLELTGCAEELISEARAIVEAELHRCVAGLLNDDRLLHLRLFLAASSGAADGTISEG
ncbi:MarR family winged helix-turn-helix transcriptional regulator [Nocardioides conyzicola]